ncbi:uncharacterized protein MELLADRAFT_105461 [Melampsora larici-populina 98AG31]|uniref:U1-type domain-containing protein n=1 Tax=Melampsora larici-populina (strain 98AG31 / pathotype 3-4-7) TaxID=747676 RepID=F4RI74_MELLP|nr:uncharacterized protein MELLADRAFT_105461 [Melampsora larici-populina 98AG31]EGG07955.1 hypothetical protein MELLADRAFT_105461 [Melampsora larici-populina 98AG31]
MPSDPYTDIEAVSLDPVNPRFRCNACNTRGMANYEHHVRSSAHQNKVARYLSRIAAKEQALVGLEAQESRGIDPPEALALDAGLDFEPDPNPEDAIGDPPSPLTYLRSLQSPDVLGDQLLNHPTDTDDPDARIRFNML